MAVIFDLDGTLLDTPHAIVTAFLAVFEAMNKEGVKASDVRATIGMPLDIAFAGLLAVDKHDPSVSWAAKKYVALFREMVLPNAKSLVFPGVLEGLESLKCRGVLMAVATSKAYKNAESLLKAAGLFDYFDVVVGADQVTKPKPHPEMGLLVMKELGITANQAVMVGDTTHDVLMGRGAGMHTVAVTYGIHDSAVLEAAGAHKIVDSFQYVISHIGALPCCAGVYEKPVSSQKL